MSMENVSPMIPARRSARQRILDAAAEISRECGAGSMSLDAVAARAGVSKGGLLYHFPSKAKLLEGMVEHFLGAYDKLLSERIGGREDEADSVACAFIDLFLLEPDTQRPPPSGLLAALAENPELVAPVRRYERGLLDRMKANASDPAVALIAYLAIRGIRNAKLLNLGILTEEEFSILAERLRQLLSGRDGRSEAEPDAAATPGAGRDRR